MEQRRVYEYVSPNGHTIIGTVETVIFDGLALISGITEDGEPLYEGSTEVDWEKQRLLKINGQRRYQDEAGLNWRFQDLVRRD